MSAHRRQTGGGRPPAPDARRARCRRAAFTLVEMLVSLAVLTVALSVVGVVFAVTTKTASQAAAYSEVLNWVRQWETQIREDLRYVDPARSVMVICGRKQPAALTREDLVSKRWFRVRVGDPSKLSPPNYDPQGPNDEATTPDNWVYSHPRADILMFITNRPAVSQAPVANLAGVNQYTSAAAGGARFAPQIVVYGHAARTAPLWSAGTSSFGFPNEYQNNSGVQHIEQLDPADQWPVDSRRSVIPADEWPLARVARLIVPSTGITGGAQCVTVLNTGSGLLGNEGLRNARCQADAQWPGDMVVFDLDTFLGGFAPSASFNPTDAALLDPYGRNGPWSGWNVVPPAWSATPLYFSATLETALKSLIFGNPSSTPWHHFATVLTETPVELRSNVGVQMLPGCAWFQVEVLMGEDPRNSITYAQPFSQMTDPNWPNTNSRSDFPRWTSVPLAPVNSPELGAFIFAPDTAANRQLIQDQVLPPGGGSWTNTRLFDFARVDQNPSYDTNPAAIVNGRIVRTWPYAIRVTVYAYDPHGRLAADQPVIRSVVHRFE